MRLSTEQLVRILSEAPDGLNHIGIYNGQLAPMHNSCGTVHNMDDLKEIVELRQQCDALSAAVVTALRGTLLDEQGNRDDDGLLPHHETFLAIKALAEVEGLAIKEPGHGLRDILAKAVESLRFPSMLRRMWSGGEVMDWLKGEAERIRQGGK